MTAGLRITPKGRTVDAGLSDDGVVIRLAGKPARCIRCRRGDHGPKVCLRPWSCDCECAR